MNSWPINFWQISHNSSPDLPQFSLSKPQTQTWSPVVWLKIGAMCCGTQQYGQLTQKRSIVLDVISQSEIKTTIYHDVGLRSWSNIGLRGDKHNNQPHKNHLCFGESNPSLHLARRFWKVFFLCVHVWLKCSGGLTGAKMHLHAINSAMVGHATDARPGLVVPLPE